MLHYKLYVYKMILSANIIIISLLFFHRFWFKEIVARAPLWFYAVVELILYVTITLYRQYGDYYIGGILWCIWMLWAIGYFVGTFSATFYFVHDGQTQFEVVIKKDFMFYHPSNINKPGMFDYSMTVKDLHAQAYLYLIRFWFLIILLIICSLIWAYLS